jgi:hypothetical protein
MIGNVKKGMKNHSVEYEKTRETLLLAASPEGPLARREGGGEITFDNTKGGFL